MNKSKTLLKILYMLLGLTALFGMSVLAAVWLLPNVDMRIRYVFLILFGTIALIVLMFAVMCITEKREERRKIAVRTLITGAFIVYLICFFIMVFLVKAFSNHESFVFAYNKHWLSDSLDGLIPLGTLSGSLTEYALGTKSFARVLFEIGGNMTAYIPFAFFIPAFSKSMRYFDSFIPFIVFVTVFVELFQGMFGLGSCQFDDFLLGAGFSIIAFAILKIPAVVSFFEKYDIYF